jgi:pimeloyl-ACP methyl ester carboxylesterase
MGGLVTRYAMSNYRDHVDKVIYVGTPFQPGLSFLGDYQEGSTTGFNKKIQDPEALFSAPALLALLPHSSQENYEKEDLLNIETWKKHEIGLFKDNKVNEASFNTNLSRIREFNQVIDQPQEISRNNIFIVGNCQDTWSKQFDGEKINEPGDSRVVAEGAIPLEYRAISSTNILFNCAPHDQQLNTPEVVKQIIEFLK